MNRIFPVIAHARSGSTLLCRQLEAVADGRVYMEIFHQNPDVIRNHLHDSADRLFARFAPLEGSALRERLAARPLDMLAALSDLDDGRDLFFKVFPGHLQAPQMREVLEHSAGVIVLHRNLLHSFISSRIARQIRKWTTVDTSGRKITFDPEDFIGHLRQVTGFYARVEADLRKADTPSSNVFYETLADPANGESTLRDALSGLPVALRVAATGANRPDLKRQDSRPRASDKVDNPGELLDFLESLGIAAADDGSIPLQVGVFREALARHRAAPGGSV